LAPAARTLRPLCLVALLVGVAAAGLLQSGASMAEECPLTAPLILKDLQGGFVGQTGTVWTIAPDCSFTVARQTGPNTADPHKHGRLTSDQEKRLAALLARIELASLPEQLGGAPQPNAHQITVSHGQTLCVLNLPPAGSGADPRHATADPLAAWVLELGDILKNMIGI
jgi:hypothetical protein